MAIALSIISIGIILWSLWTRRHTWRVKWETAATTNVTLLAAAALLGAPPPSLGTLLGTWLQHFTGVWNLQFWLANICVLGALCAIVYNAVARLEPPCPRNPHLDFKTWFRRWIQIPTAIGTLFITALFTGARASTTPHPDLGTMPIHGIYMRLYWMGFGLLITYLLCHGVRAFIDLWHDKPSRPTMNIYLTASAVAGICVAIRIATAAITTLETTAILTVMDIAGYVGASLFCIGAAYSWIRRVRWIGGSDKRFLTPPEGTKI